MAAHRGGPGHEGRAGPTLMVFAAEALAAPTGLLTMALLTRAFGSEGYGAYALAAVIVGWAQVVLMSLLGRASQTFVAGADDPDRAAADVVFLHVLTGAAGAAVLALAAHPIAIALRAPPLGGYLLIASLDLALFTAAQGCRSVAMARDRFGLRAALAAARWLARLGFIAALVLAGFGVPGAILGAAAASGLELAVALVRLRPARPTLRLAGLDGFWRIAAPLSLSGLALRLFEKVDLIAVQLVAGAAAAGLYAAAQNVTVVAGIFGMSYGAVLVTRAARLRGDGVGLGALADEALRLCLRLAPGAALGALCAPELAVLAFGRAFAGAAPLVALLAGAALAFICLGAATAILTGAGQVRTVLALTAPVLPIAVLGHAVLAPRFGGEGAAACTFAVAAAAATAAWAALARRVRLGPVRAAAARNLLACALVGAVAFARSRLSAEGLAMDAAAAAGLAIFLLAAGEFRLARLRQALGYSR